MLPFTMKSRSLPSDLPLSDVAPLEEYIGTSTGYWKIYRSKLISSQLEVSIFVFDKLACNKLKQKKTTIGAVWRHIDMIQNIQKYSSVTLKIILTAKENRKYIAYATEPVIGSLANVLGDYPNDISRTHSSVLNKMSLCEMEIKYGVVAIAETLSYLHLYEGMIHCDVSPRNIIVCSNGSWRLSGFHFLMRADIPQQLDLKHAPDTMTSEFLQPDINFAAPCLFLGTPTQESDIFSLGMVITYVYNNGISLIEGTAIIGEISKTNSKEMDELYDERISSAYNAIRARIPDGLQHGLSKIISFDVDARPTAQQFLMLGYYHDPLIKYLKRINLYENLTESDKGVVLSTELPKCAKALPQTMLVCHVIPIVAHELEVFNRCAGVVHTLVVCLGRTLTTTNSERVCELMNVVLDVNRGTQLSPQAHQILMADIQLLFCKYRLINTLNSPNPVVMLGLDDTDKVIATLSAISELLVHRHTGVDIMTPEMVDHIKSSFEYHWNQGRKEICTSYLKSILLWLSSLTDKALTQDFSLWFVTLISKDLNILHVIKDVLMSLLNSRTLYNLTQEFIQNELSFAVENLISLPEISNAQRQTLVQLARHTGSIAMTQPTGAAGLTKHADITGSSCSLTRDAPLSLKAVSTRVANRCLNRQSGTTVLPPDHRSPPTLAQPTFSFVVSVPEGVGGKPDTTRVNKGRASSKTRTRTDMAAEQKRKLFQMELSPSRSPRVSFGELMADIDDRCSETRSPLLSKEGRARSLQATSGQEKSEYQMRRSSLQAEHYHSMNICSAPPKVLAPPSTPQMSQEESSAPKFDSGLMKSILQRLDSLAAHFNSKNGSSVTINDGTL